MLFCPSGVCGAGEVYRPNVRLQEAGQEPPEEERGRKACPSGEAHPGKHSGKAKGGDWQ